MTQILTQKSNVKATSTPSFFFTTSTSTVNFPICQSVSALTYRVLIDVHFHSVAQAQSVPTMKMSNINIFTIAQPLFSLARTMQDAYSRGNDGFLKPIHHTVITAL